MLLYILFALFFGMLVLTYFLFKRDIIHPAVMFSFMFTTSIGCAIYNVDKWKIDLHQNTFWILIGMAIEFIAISYAVSFIYKHRKKNEVLKEDEQLCNVKKWKLVLAIVFDIIYIIGIVYFVQKIASNFGQVNSYSEALKLFKANTVYKANAKLPKLITVSTKFVISFAYIYMFIGIKKFLYSKERIMKKIIEFISYIIPAALYSLSLLLQSSRGSILRLIFTGGIIFIILWYRKNKYEKVVKIKNILAMFCVGIIMFLSFYSVSGLIGRDTLNNNMVEYMTMYGGGSIQLFDIYLQKPVQKGEVNGIETFWGEYRFLDDYNIISLKQKPTGSLEWRKSNGVEIGNVYTAYRRWIQDYGIVGCVIILAFVCLLYNIFYNELRNRNENDGYNLSLILYAYLYYHLILISIDCRIFDELIPASITQFMVTAIVYFGAVKSNWKEFTIKCISKIKQIKE